MVVKLSSLQRHLKRIKEEKEDANAPPPPDAPGAVHFGPLEQAIMVLVIVGLLSDPASTGVQSILSPGVMMVLILGYVGYRLLERQKQAEVDARNRPPPPKRPAPEKDSKDDKVSSSSTGVKTKEDLLKEQSRLKDKATGVDKDVRAPTKKTQYFLTMNGPGKPALVPFPRGFKAKAHTPDGTMWWNNVDQLKIDDICVPSAPPAKSSREERKEEEKEKERQALLPGTISAEEIKERMPLEKEMERYEKVMMIMQAILSLLLCFVDQRLGLGLLALFLFFHFKREHAKERQRARNIAALPPGTKNPYEEEGGEGLFGGFD